MYRNVRNQEIIKLYEQGYSSYSIAKKLGISTTTVLNVLKENNIKIRTRKQQQRSRIVKSIIKHLKAHLNDIQSSDYKYFIIAIARILYTLYKKDAQYTDQLVTQLFYSTQEHNAELFMLLEKYFEKEKQKEA